MVDDSTNFQSEQPDLGGNDRGSIQIQRGLRSKVGQNSAFKFL